ncbi:MAG TPA: GNAT family N-acetyltransferase [Acidimicrobiia bacterium]|nr:GNAT family N-acetyltransferase [Acidimicrobiia bacterium]
MPEPEWAHQSETDLGPMTSRPLTPERFPDMETVFGERGVARRCFCMYWRRPDQGHRDDRDNKDRFADLVSAGRTPGLVGYVAQNDVSEDPVGWVQVGPRTEFPTLDRSRLLRRLDDVDVWSINCFVVRAGHRKRGVGAGLLAAAIDFAKTQGATVIEAYPVDGPRSSSVDYFTGTLSMFDEHGFVELIRRNDTRPIVRLTV